MIVYLSLFLCLSLDPPDFFSPSLQIKGLIHFLLDDLISSNKFVVSSNDIQCFFILSTYIEISPLSVSLFLGLIEGSFQKKLTIFKNSV